MSRHTHSAILLCQDGRESLNNLKIHTKTIYTQKKSTIHTQTRQKRPIPTQNRPLNTRKRISGSTPISKHTPILPDSSCLIKKWSKGISAAVERSRTSDFLNSACSTLSGVAAFSKSRFSKCHLWWLRSIRGWSFCLHTRRNLLCILVYLAFRFKLFDMCHVRVYHDPMYTCTCIFIDPYEYS